MSSTKLLQERIIADIEKESHTIAQQIEESLCDRVWFDSDSHLL